GARVNATRARDALELEALTDVDALRASGHALVALDAAAFLLRTLAAARIATRGVVGDDQRIVVRHRTLETRVRAQVVAELLAEPREIEEPAGREDADQRIAERSGIARPQDPRRTEEAHERHRHDECSDRKQR